MSELLIKGFKQLGTDNVLTLDYSGITPANIGAAPAGYGLGTVASPISNTDLVDTLKLAQSGWYRGTNVTNAPVTGWCFFEIIADSAAYSAIKAYPASGGEYTSAYVNSVLKPWTFNATTDYALARDGSNVMTGSLTVQNNGSSATLGQIDNTSIIANRNVVGSNANLRQLLLRNSAKSADIKSALLLQELKENQDPKVYTILHTGNVDDYALKKDGSNTMTGDLVIEKGLPSVLLNGGDGGVHGQFYQLGNEIHVANKKEDGSKSVELVLESPNEALNKAVKLLYDGVEYDIYHKGNKPTTADIKALAVKTSSAYDTNTCCDAALYQVQNGSNIPSGNRYGTLLALPYSGITGNTIPVYGTQIFIPNGDDSTKPDSMFFRTSLRDTWRDWKEVATTDYVDALTAADVGAAASSHNHAASNITSGTLSSDRLPTVPVTKGGTGATDAATARTNLGITLANLGAAASSHNQAASTITTGTFAGAVVANSSGQTYSTSLLRNSKLVSSATNPTVNGEINWIYE